MSYSGNPAASDIDAVRFYIGDTDTTAEMLTDAEITALVTLAGGDTLLAAVYAAEGLAGKYARRVDKSVGDLSISYSQTSKQFSDLAALLRRRYSIGSAPAPYAGGISISDKAAQESDTDRVRPAFTRTLHNNTEPAESE